MYKLYANAKKDTTGLDQPKYVIRAGRIGVVPAVQFFEHRIAALLGGHEDLAIGGLVLDSYAQGKLAADIALSVLVGGSLSPVPVSSGEGVFVFSRSQLTRWKIDLPDDIAAQSIFVP